MLDKIRSVLGFDSIEEKVERALNLEKSIQDNKDKAMELAENFLPKINDLEKAIELRGIAYKARKSELDKLDDLALKGRYEDKLAIIKSEYYTEIGELRKSNISLKKKLSSLINKKGVADAVTLFKYKDSLEKGFNSVLEAFEKGMIDEKIFSKAFVTYKGKMSEEIEVKEQGILEKALSTNQISLDFFEKALKSAKEKKVEKVMKEFKEGKLKSSSGEKVTSKEQAIAIAMSEAGMSKSEDEKDNNLDKGKEKEEEKPEKISDSHLKDMIVEHERLVKVLGSIKEPSGEVKKELETQKRELEEYKKQLGEGKVEKSEDNIEKAEYEGREVELNKPMKGDSKKYKVYVRDPKTKNIRVVHFGDPNMEIKRDDPERRKNFRARHNCSDKKDITSAGYWSCKLWSSKPVSEIVKGFNDGLVGDGELLEDLIKAKYYKREGGPGNYKYYYSEAEYKQAKGKQEGSGEEKESSKQLSKEEVQAVDGYTSQDYRKINRELRNPPPSEESQKKIDKVNSAIDKLDKHKGVVFRGMSMPDNIEKLLDSWQKGNSVTMDSFTSSSTDQKVAGGFGDFQIKINSKGKNGADISNLSGMKAEKEVLFKSGTNFKVKSIKVKKLKTPFGDRVVSVNAVLDEI
jgi:hypothetical protein